MSFGGFSDIQRDRDRAHSSRHRNRDENESRHSEGEGVREREREREGEREREFSPPHARRNDESGFSRREQQEQRMEGGREGLEEEGAGGRRRRGEQGREEGEGGEGGEGERHQQPYRGGAADGGAGYGGVERGYGGANSYSGGGAVSPPRNDSGFRENSQGVNGGGAGKINWEAVAGEVAEAGINRFAKAYDKSSQVNKEPGTNGSGYGGQPSAFGQRLAGGGGSGSGGSGGSGSGDIVGRALGGVRATIEKLTGEKK